MASSIPYIGAGGAWPIASITSAAVNATKQQHTAAFGLLRPVREWPGACECNDTIESSVAVEARQTVLQIANASVADMRAVTDVHARQVLSQIAYASVADVRALKA